VITEVAVRYQDPISSIVADAFELPHLKTSILIDYVMGHLPSNLPAWAVTDYRRGIGVRVSRELRRTWTWEDRHGNKQQQRVYVALNGYHKPFRHISLSEYRSYIAGLEQSSRYDRARITFHKRQYIEAERQATGDIPAEIGELLGFSDG
jgi:hypothetical protein